MLDLVVSISEEDPKKVSSQIKREMDEGRKEKRTSGEKKSYKNPFKRNKIPNQKQNK